MRKVLIAHKGWAVGLAVFSVLVPALYVYAGDALGVHSFTFDPFQTKLVSAEWMIGAGCPTGATAVDFSGTPTPVTDPVCLTGDSTDHNNTGLVLVKTGPSITNFASAGAFITGVKGITLTDLGYDIRSGGHCGAGAPRFNVQATDGFHFIGGCSNGTVTFSSLAWKRVRFDSTNPAQAFPPIAAGATVVSIQIVFDEGTDTGPDFSGLAVLDNIDINGTLKGKE